MCAAHERAAYYTQARALCECAAAPTVLTHATHPYLIVHVNKAWEALCGWRLEEVIGKSCKLLQGPQTCPAAVLELSTAVAQHRSITLRLFNHKKDGTHTPCSQAPLSRT